MDDATDLSTFDPDLYSLELKKKVASKLLMRKYHLESTMLSLTSIAAKKVDTKDGVKAVMDVTWHILDEEVKKETELEKPTCRQGIFLDVNKKGGLDRGKNKNVTLG